MKKVYTFAFIAFSVLLSISCNNYFSDGNKLRAEIESIIEYNKENSFKVRFLGENGKISPSGIIDVKKTDEKMMIFSPDNEYDFVKWIVVDNATGKQLTEEEQKKIIHIDDIYNPETSIKFLEKNEITIKPVCTLRPSVISKTPQTQANGVFRSVRIWIMFDTNMDESSIYYSDEECKELEKQGFVLFKDTNTSTKRNGKCYGYWDGKNDSSIVFKNIKIKDKKTSENLLKCFDAPYFDSEINDVLIVPTKKVLNETTKKYESLAPASGTYVFVELDKNFVYKENENKLVTMKGPEKWSYLVNGNADITSPSWTSLSVTGKDKSDSSRDLKQNTVPDNKDGYLATYIKDNKITVNGVIFDGESGPAKVRLNYRRIKDEENNGVSEYSSEVIIYPKVQENTGTLEDIIDCENWADGIYELKFIAEDENGNESVYTPANSEIETTYILKNTFTPNLGVTENRNALTSANISVTHNVISDFYESASVTAKNVDDESAENIIEPVKGGSVNIAGLEGFKHYQYTYEVKDIFGRTYSVESSVDRKAPEKPTEFLSGTSEITTSEDIDGQVIVYWKTPSDADVVRIGYEEYGKSKAAPEIEISNITGKKMNRIIPLYRNGKRYSFDIYAVDFSGNVSEPYSFSTKNYINSKGNVVFNNREITYTSLAPVLRTRTTFKTISLPSNCKSEDFRGAFTNARGSSVTLDPYEMGKYHVTNRLYNLVSGEYLDGLSNDPRWPIRSVTYYHAVIFCNKLSIALGFKPCYSFGSYSTDEVNTWNFWAINGRDMDRESIFKDLKCDFGANGFRLPTELEWECCARGADETKWEWKNCYAGKTDAVWSYYNSTGYHEVRIENNSTYLDSLRDSSIYYVDNNLSKLNANGKGDPYSVGSFNPTSTGQYDMSGLLWEWCWDTYQDIGSGSSIYGKVNYSNGKEQGNLNNVWSNRVIRGGYHYDTNTTNFKVFYRNQVSPVANDARYTDWIQAGFRLCRTLEE